MSEERQISMDISRWSETSDIINESLERDGSYEATLQALLQCFAAGDCGRFSADLNAISLFYPVMLQDKTKYAISILLNLAAVALSYSDALIESIDRAVTIIADDRIVTAWQQSVWRKNPHL